MTDNRHPRQKAASGFFVRNSLLLFCLLLFVTLSESWAATSPEQSADTKALANNAKFINGRIKDVEGTDDMEEGTKKKLLELYRQSLDNIKATTSQNTLADNFAKSIETAPAETKKIREEKQKVPQLPAEALSALLDDADLQEIDQRLLQAKTNFTTVSANVESLSNQLADQNERPTLASQRLSEIKNTEEELQAVLKTPPAADEAPQVTEALRWVQQTKLQALQSERKSLNQELVSMPVLLDLAKAQQEAATAELEQASSLMQTLETKRNQRRQAEAAKTMAQAEEAMRQVADKPQILQQAAAANTALSDELQSSTAALEHITSERDTLAKKLKKLEDTLSNTKQKIALAGLSQALGRVLTEQKRSLPDARLLKKEISKNETRITETGLNQFQKEEERKQFSDLDSYIAELTVGTPPEEEGQIDSELRGFLESRLELLDKIIVSSQNYLGLLAELDIVYRQTLSTVTAYDAFLSERLLWMRSTSPLHLKDVSVLPSEAAVFLSPTLWINTFTLLAAQEGSLSFITLAILIAVVILANKKRLNSLLENLVGQACNPASYRFALPIQALAVGLVCALPWPLMFATLGWQTQNLADPSDFSKGVGIGLLKLAYRLFLLRSLIILIRPNALAARFFHWSAVTLKVVLRESRLLITFFLPAVFITQLTYMANYHSSNGVVLGRVSFIVALSLLGSSLYRILHPKTGIWQRHCKGQSQRILIRLYPAFFILVMLLFPLFMGMILAGYVITTSILLTKLIDSLWFAFGLIVCHQLLEQWLLQSSRKLAIQEAHKRHAAVQLEEEGEGATPGDKDAATVVSSPAEDLASLSANSRKLLDTIVIITGIIGLWLLWKDVLPAFKVFDEYVLWQYASTVNGQPSQLPVSVTDAGLAILISIIVMTLTRHFPSLLEIVLLQHLEMPQGSRYTVKTLTRYIIGGIGASLVASKLGFSWGQIQWLAAGLSVGIGFGLQEIVANFISGIIILFERPIRVGDVITIGTTDGTVTRIRIRATTIRDFDRKELLVPNKEFISGRLLNWSLSDPVIRILIPVGIAYGSDVDKACALMVEAARENTMILTDPEPQATFDAFGDNALALTLRFFIGSVDDRLPATSAMHHAIDKKFKAAGLCIAFPQRDIHLDTNRPLDIRILREQTAG